MVSSAAPSLAACGKGGPTGKSSASTTWCGPAAKQTAAPLRERGIKLYHGDIRNPSDLETLPRCDWIIEAAANPSVLAGVDGKTSSRQLIEHNLVGTINMLELLKQWRCGFTILSTSRVYSIRALAAIPVETQGDRFVPRIKDYASPPPAPASPVTDHRSLITITDH